MASFNPVGGGTVVAFGPFTVSGDIGVGLQAVAKVTANLTNANATMTVTAVEQGDLRVGMAVSGTGIPAGATISALGTGTGGVGTYTLSANATATNTGVAVTATRSEPGLDTEATRDVSVQVTGNFGTGGTVVVEGSNDGVNWATLNDLGGTALSFTAAGLRGVRERVKWLRPRLSAGTGTISLTVSVFDR